MSVVKSEIKMLTARDIGNSLDDQLESLEQNVYRHQGAYTELKKTATEITTQLHAHVKKDFDEGLIPEAMSPLELVSFVKRWITKAGELCSHRGDLQQTSGLIASGGADAIKKAILAVKKVYDVEKGKKEALEEAQAQGGIIGNKISVVDRTQRTVGQHPGPSSLAERRAEAKTLKAKKIEEDQPKGSNGSNGDSKEKLETKPVKRKVGRKPKKKSTKNTEDVKN